MIIKQKLTFYFHNKNSQFFIINFVFLLLNSIIFFTPSIVKAEENHPRLFINDNRINQIQQAIQVPNSHHQQAFTQVKNRVEQEDWRVYATSENSTRYNYARSFLAKEAAFLYLITQEQKYAQIAYNTITAIYEDPDPENRLPDQGYGLSRATVGMNIAIAYDWAYQGLTQPQRDYLKAKINLALDAWLDYQHANLKNPLMASNWVAVCRGGELVMMLAIYAEKNRAERYKQLKEWLKTHLTNGYGELGLSQEGIGYTSYAGTFLLPAIYALNSVGDNELNSYLQRLDFWKLIMYAGAFFMDEQYGERQFLQSGVSGTTIIDEGWASLLLGSVLSRQLPFYRYFYDFHMGVKAAGDASQKFDERRGGTIWAMIYYPESAPSFNPTGIFPNALNDYQRGATFFRNRWQDENDILLSIMTDINYHRHAWDQSEAFQLGLLAYQTHFISGPAKDKEATLYSSLLIDGNARVRGATGKAELFTSFPDGGYVIVDGGEKYQSLGIDNVKRHLLVKFNANENQAIISTLDQIQDQQTHTYTWQLNLGNKPNQEQLITKTEVENGVNTFTVYGNNNSYLKGWILNANEGKVNANEPLQVNVTAANVNIWIVMIVGQGIPPIATLEGKGMSSQLTIEDVTIMAECEENNEKCRIKTLVNSYRNGQEF